MGERTIVYLVDDDEDDRMFTREALEGVLKEIEVIEFTNGQQLLNALENNLTGTEPSLILLDINMPRVSGLEALSAIRSEPSICHIPVILFSTGGNPETTKKAYQMGVNAYVIKPFSALGYAHMANAAALYFAKEYSLEQSSDRKMSLTAKNILVIEDNADHWHLMRLVLESLGIVRLVHRDSAESTMEFLMSEYDPSRQPVELIILDLYLPRREQGLDLIELIRAFFKTNNLPSVPIIIFSASDDKDDIKASYQRLANAYIPKSTDITQSLLCLNDVWGLWATTAQGMA